ncbi:hypothetical protein C8R46DRAFT_1279271 [Mycena filopes]|nr:hypothetical protein C8R46DRAFT_1279271 [Mycena filopes]
MAPQGVNAALAGASPIRTALSMFSLADRVALVTGGQRGIGLEMALALAEAGAVVYCLDLPAQPNANWLAVQKFASELPPAADLKNGGRLEYISGDVTDQKAMWAAVEGIVQREGRIDVLDVNVSGVLFTAQAAGRQMERLGIAGSIILTASISGTITNQDQKWVAYNTSKSAVLQMGRSLACELAPKGIRVNTISPGCIHTNMTGELLAESPGLEEKLSAQNPMGRFARPDELRGVTLYLASDASTFCTGSDIKVDGGQCAW